MMYEGSIKEKARKERNRQHRSLAILLAIGLLAMLNSCEQGLLYTENHTIKDQLWLMDDTVGFAFTIDDTASIHDLLIYVRNTTDYPNRNIFFFINTRFPDGREMHDTLEFMLANPDGSWKGSGRGFYKENRILYRYNTRFAQAGDYSLSLLHAMRTDTLKGIDELGLIIRQAKYLKQNGK